MNRIYSIILAFLSLVTLRASTQKLCDEKIYSWAVIGGGPAGIGTVAGLLDNNILPRDIVWIDPNFQAGQFGQYYEEVESNTSVHDFYEIFSSTPTFKKIDYQNTLDPFLTPENKMKGCMLALVKKPLLKITEYLTNLGLTYTGIVQNLCHMPNKSWALETNEKIIHAQKVVLATGSHPRKLDYVNDRIIDLFKAFSRSSLKDIISPEDTIAVFGNSHSAVLVIQNLLSLPFKVKKIINFYRSAIPYAELDEFNKYNASEGLSGELAIWAKETIEDHPPRNLLRIYNTSENRKKFESSITKVIYAIGFERNAISISSDNPDDFDFFDDGEISYDDRTGKIAENLYGIGIAFPEGFIDKNGKYQRKVEVRHFVEFANKQIPEWIKE